MSLPTILRVFCLFVVVVVVFVLFVCFLCVCVCMFLCVCVCGGGGGLIPSSYSIWISHNNNFRHSATIMRYLCVLTPPAVRPSLIDRWTRDRSRAPACCAHDGETGIDVSAQVLTRINSKTVLNPVSAGRMFRPDMLTRLTGR